MFDPWSREPTTDLPTAAWIGTDFTHRLFGFTPSRANVAPTSISDGINALRPASAYVSPPLS